MLRHCWLPNALSVSRIPASLALIGVYERQPGIWFCITACLLACIVASDIADGYLARRHHFQSRQGYIFDGWGDRAFHIAIYLIFFAEGVFGLGFVWMLIFREVSVYALRSLEPNWHSAQTTFDRTLTRSHAAMLRVLVTVDLLRPALNLPIGPNLHAQIIIVAIGAWNLAIYGQLSRDFLAVWRRLNHHG